MTTAVLATVRGIRKIHNRLEIAAARSLYIVRRTKLDSTKKHSINNNNKHHSNQQQTTHKIIFANRHCPTVVYLSDNHKSNSIYNLHTHIHITMSRVFVSKSETICRRSLLNPTSFRQQQQSIGSARYLLATTNATSSSSLEQPQKRWMGHTVRLIAMEDLPHGKVRNFKDGDRLVAKVYRRKGKRFL